LWDGAKPIDGNIFTFNFGTSIATPWALGPAFQAIAGVRVDVPASVDKREFQAPVGELRITRLEPDVFRSGAAGDRGV
jgi:hypothetical protein